MPVEVVPGSEAAEDGCEVPFDSDVTDVNETALFGPEGYNDYAAWGELTGLLAVKVFFIDTYREMVYGNAVRRSPFYTMLYTTVTVTLVWQVRRRSPAQSP